MNAEDEEKKREPKWCMEDEGNEGCECIELMKGTLVFLCYLLSADSNYMSVGRKTTTNVVTAQLK